MIQLQSWWIRKEGFMGKRDPCWKPQSHFKCYFWNWNTFESDTFGRSQSACWHIGTNNSRSADNPTVYHHLSLSLCIRTSKPISRLFLIHVSLGHQFMSDTDSMDLFILPHVIRASYSKFSNNHRNTLMKGIIGHLLSIPVTSLPPQAQRP